MKLPSPAPSIAAGSGQGRPVRLLQDPGCGPWDSCRAPVHWLLPLLFLPHTLMEPSLQPAPGPWWMGKTWVRTLAHLWPLPFPWAFLVHHHLQPHHHANSTRGPFPSLARSHCHAGLQQVEVLEDSSLSPPLLLSLSGLMPILDSPR